VSSVAAAILAAGASRRLGRPKQLVPLGGVSLVRRMANVVRGSRCDRVGVVVGAAAGSVREELRSSLVDVVENPAWEEGIASSIRTAAEWALDRGADALVIVLSDQPALHASHIDKLISAFDGGAELASSFYADKRAVPALFGSRWFGHLAALRGDTGASSLLQSAASVIEVPWAEGALDVDTAADLAGWANRRVHRRHLPGA
jgi:CTP:molybdopterin cytidylyltransferase MocA